MYRISIDNGTEYNFDIVQGTVDPLFAYKKANNLPLADLPYSREIRRAFAGTQTTTIETKSYDSVFMNGVPVSFHTNTWSYDQQVIMDSYNSAYLNARRAADQWIAYFKDVSRNILLEKLRGESLNLIDIYRERRATSDLVMGFIDKSMFTIRNWRRPRAVLRKWGYKTVSRRQLRAVRTALRNVDTYGDAWFTYWFAIRPAIGDVHAAINTCYNVEKRLTRKKRNSKTKVEHLVETNECDISVDAFMRIGVSYTVSDTTLASIALVENPAEGLWEAIPWTWVLDYVVNVGQYLGLLNATLGLSFLSGYESSLIKMTATFKPQSSFYMIDLWSWRRISVTYKCPPREDVLFSRQLLYDFPSPTLEFPPDFWNWKRVGHAAALFAQRCRKSIHEVID